MQQSGKPVAPSTSITTELILSKAILSCEWLMPLSISHSTLSLLFIATLSREIGMDGSIPVNISNMLTLEDNSFPLFEVL